MSGKKENIEKSVEFIYEILNKYCTNKDEINIGYLIKEIKKGA